MNMQTDTVHKQFEALMRQGLTMEETCSVLRNLGYTVVEVDQVRRTAGDRGPGRPLQRLTARPAAPRSNSLPADRSWDKPKSPRWDKVIARAWLALDLVALGLMGVGSVWLGDYVPPADAMGFGFLLGGVSGLAFLCMRRSRR